jgi:hypothetical protein
MQVVLNGPEPKPFTFDFAAGSNVTQHEMFELIGRPFADSCLAGYFPHEPLFLARRLCHARPR